MTVGPYNNIMSIPTWGAHYPYLDVLHPNSEETSTQGLAFLKI